MKLPGPFGPKSSELIHRAAQVYTRLTGMYYALGDTYRTLTLQFDPRYSNKSHLARFGYGLYSLHDEDGIIAEIFRRIGTSGRPYFVEFGVDALQNNSLALLLNGWSGAWLEGSAEKTTKMSRILAKPIAAARLSIKNAMITAENIDQLFTDIGVPAEFDLLSIDLDGNDYWIWNALSRFRPRVVAMEYNASLGPVIDAVGRYNPEHTWGGGRAYGASLKALERLAEKKGYRLVGCCFGGTNAFFVRSDLVGEKFPQPYTSEVHFEPPRYLWRPYTGHPVGEGDIDYFWNDGVPRA